MRTETDIDRMINMLAAGGRLAKVEQEVNAMGYVNWFRREEPTWRPTKTLPE